jgi:hypothetical protein
MIPPLQVAPSSTMRRAFTVLKLTLMGRLPSTISIGNYSDAVTSDLSPKTNFRYCQKVGAGCAAAPSWENAGPGELSMRVRDRGTSDSGLSRLASLISPGVSARGSDHIQNCRDFQPKKSNKERRTENRALWTEMCSRNLKNQRESPYGADCSGSERRYQRQPFNRPND